jgi:beta/gamma crystallin
MKSRIVCFSFASIMLLAGVAQAAEITLYKQPYFTGSQLTLRGYTPNLANVGFRDQASSVVVTSGRWEVCTQPDFKGQCVTLDRGEYPTLDSRLNRRIESAREVGSYAEQTGSYNRYGRGSIELYGQPGFKGKTLELTRDTPDLETIGFNDRAASVVVNEGTWQLCSDGGYGGSCRTYAPGRYADLGYGMAKQVSSARLVRSSRDAPAVFGGGVNAPVTISNDGTSRVILFSEPNFRGASVAVSGINGSMDRTGFDDTAASMVIEGGRWIFCTEPYFRGECKVIGPGRYNNLRDVGLNRSISSVRPAAASDVVAAPAPPPPPPPAPVRPVPVRPAQPSFPTGGSAYTPNTDIELFRGANFDNGAYATQRDMSQLDPEFERKTSSAIVYAGRWELCTERDYGGRCVVYGPGRYPDLGGLNNQIASLRRVR